MNRDNTRQYLSSERSLVTEGDKHTGLVLAPRVYDGLSQRTLDTANDLVGANSSSSYTFLAFRLDPELHARPRVDLHKNPKNRLPGDTSTAEN